LDIDRAIPIGLIVNELVTNAFKHAFSNTKQPKINVSLAHNHDGSMELKVFDNGSGIGANGASSKSFGMKLVHTLVEQLNGTMQQKHDNGTIYNIQIRA
jgi:two-component sensor histidine kinase